MSISDEHFRALRTLILEQNVEIKGLAREVRRLKEKIEELGVDYELIAEMEETPVMVYKTEMLEDLIKTRSRREPGSGKE
ncbi:hypothetical protein [Shinella granuli]|uniref:Uncharacterized protein n=1 Tax=Shinella granuli TaxID=323621 RepID=A0A4R2BX41_SHIGR|nr:hypothetical protein [Shinella granuli]TCN30614.1 hypothetical protein EV665_1623 [Shinella granuli]